MNKMNPKEIELLTTREAAARMRVSVDYLNSIALRGEIASVKIGTRPGKRGGRRLYPESEVTAWIMRNLKQA